ncbi:MAG: DNA/RNA nuclease SfsA, partial [Clostridia bacterium]|nr:DNA/RNA nuclease SfsA [Clostridia bacterium]
QAPNAAAEEWLRGGGLYPAPDLVRRDVKYRDSRFDLYLEKGETRCFVEVKGVTLERDGIALFPDAPTLRGAKHLRELALARRDGYEAYALFLVQMKGPRVFRPNEETDPAFAVALREAAAAGVGILAMDCAVGEDRMTVSSPVRVEL